MKTNKLVLLIIALILGINSYAQIEEKEIALTSNFDQIVDAKVKYINATDAIHIGYVYNDPTGTGGNPALDTKDPIVYRTDGNDNIVWRKVFHQNFAGEFKGLTFTYDGLYVVCVGYTSNGGYVIVNDKSEEGYSDLYKGLIAKVRLSDGAIMNHFEYLDNTNTQHGEAFFDVCELSTPIHELVVCGAHNYRPGTVDQMVCYFDQNLAHLYSSYLDHPASDLAYSISTWGNGNEVVVCGSIDNSGFQNIYLGTITHLNQAGNVLNVYAYDAASTSSFSSMILEDIQTKAGFTTLTGTIMDINFDWTSNVINSLLFDVDASFNINGRMLSQTGNNYTYYLKAKRLGLNDYAFSLCSSNNYMHFHKPNLAYNAKFGRVINGVYTPADEALINGSQMLSYVDLNTSNNKLKFAGITRASLLNNQFTINSNLTFTNSNNCLIEHPPLVTSLARFIPIVVDIPQKIFNMAENHTPIYITPNTTRTVLCGFSDTIIIVNPPTDSCLDCNDSCYWRTTANNIIGTRNKFGTITPDDVRIVTSNNYRGIISANGNWGMGTSSGAIPDARLQVHSTTLDKHIDVTGNAPSIKFYATEALPATWPNTGPKIGLATGVNNFTDNSDVGDFVIENTSDKDIIFGTNWTGTNSLERMKIDNHGEVGINTVISAGQDPNAYLHVNCSGNNPNNTLVSDVRFENLEGGNGTVLVINQNGFVLNSGKTLPNVIGNVNTNCFVPNLITKVNSASGDITCSQLFDNGTNVGVATTTPTDKLDINGTERVQSLPVRSINDRIVFAGATGQLRSLAASGITTQYLSGNGTWVNLPTTGGGNVNSSCTTANFLPKVQTSGSPNLICSQVFDNGVGVGIGTITPNVFSKLTVLNTATTLMNFGTMNRSVSTVSAIGAGAHNSSTNTTSSSITSYGSYNASNANAASIGAIGYAIGSNATTSKIGLIGLVDANSCTGNNVGVYGQVTNLGPFCNTHFAGYFAGQTMTGGPALIISDSVLKTRVRDLTDAMDIINALKPRVYDFDPSVRSGFALSNKHQYGFISQEVERVLPDVVQEVQGPNTYDADGKITESRATYKAMNYDALISVLVKAVQEQEARINDLEALILHCCEASSAARVGATSDMKIVDVKISDKNTIVLNQNVPNPFAESTSISYYIPEKFSRAQIIFSNTQGEIIKALDIKEMGKGLLNVFADDLSSGQYTYTLVVDGKTIDTKKMIKQ